MYYYAMERRFLPLFISNYRDLCIQLFRLGPRRFVDEIANSKTLWSAEGLFNPSKIVNATSISEAMPYLEICRIALEDEKVFENFKSCIEYRAVLEHCNYAQGADYLNLLTPNTSEYFALIAISSKDICNPQKYFYPKFGRYHPHRFDMRKLCKIYIFSLVLLVG